MLSPFLALAGQQDGAPPPEPPPPIRIQTERPSRGVLGPVRSGLSAFGGLINRGLLRFEDCYIPRPGAGASPTAEKCQRKYSPGFGGFGDGAGITAGLSRSRNFMGAEASASIRLSTRLYRDYHVGLLKRIGNFRTGPFLGYEVRPQEDFFGHGSETLERDRTTFETREAAAAWGSVYDLPRFRVSHMLQVRGVDLDHGTDNRFPTTQEAFTDSEVDGGFRDANWLTNEFAVFIDRRNDPINPRKGAAFDLSVAINNGLRSNQVDYTTLRYIGYYYLPITDHEEHLFAFRSELVHNVSDDEIPFYEQPTLGGSSTLRGFREYRFRDRDAAALTAEYRYRIWQHMDAVLFGDIGQVYPTLFEDFNDRSVHVAKGLGVQFHSKVFAFRLSVGNSPEGTRVFFNFGRPTW